MHGPRADDKLNERTINFHSRATAVVLCASRRVILLVFCGISTRSMDIHAGRAASAITPRFMRLGISDSAHRMRGNGLLTNVLSTRKYV